LPGPCAVDKPNLTPVVEIPLPQYQKNGRKLPKKANNNSNFGLEAVKGGICDESCNKTINRKKQGIETAKRYLQIMEEEGIETRADLARHLNVSRARVTQVLNRLK
nr:hypothetical protein [Alphaproteobacteria bacterium]